MSKNVGYSYRFADLPYSSGDLGWRIEAVGEDEIDRHAVDPVRHLGRAVQFLDLLTYHLGPLNLVFHHSSGERQHDPQISP